MTFVERPDEKAGALARLLALNRTVTVVLAAVLFFGLGEQLWEQFMPAFLRAQVKRQAAGGEAILATLLWTVGIYAFLRNLFEGFCYVGGGHLTGRLGDRGSLLLFGVLTVAGYVLFLLSPSPVLTIAAALLIMGWEPLAVPATFTAVGSTVAESRRGMAFAVQSIQKRLPKIIGPAIAGFVLVWAERFRGSPAAGQVLGMRILVGIALALALAALAIQFRWMPKRKPLVSPLSARQIVRGYPPGLRRLLLAEVFTRWCDWLVREFVLLYLYLRRGLDFDTIGLLFALQHFTALLTYLPVGRMTERVGLRPFIGLTFIFFALFPLALAVVPDGLIALAFVVYGLREVGEPARKALITSLVPEEVRARGVGLYWGIRSFAICTASLAGAGLWYAFGPRTLLLTASALGAVGAGLFYLLCRTPGQTVAVKV